MFSKKTIVTLLLLNSFCFVFAQNKLLSPDEFLPTKLGQHFTPHHLLVDYFQHVAQNSEQVVLKEYGRTNQQRPLIYAVISSTENLKRIEEIRLNNLKRTGLVDGESTNEEKLAIVWLSFGVHGNEAGSSESAIQTIYELTQSSNKEAKKWLKNTVVILDPSINPDGYSRYTHWNWNVGNKISNPHVLSREHEEPWPGGRVNHYLFDLNRDWAWQTQVETQQRLDIYQAWMPHVHVDFHEMFYNDSYYFAPAAQPYHDYITSWQANFQTQVGQNHARYFNEKGWLYFTREVFDLFYPSYGDTYPIFNGAIGMTYEQGGHSRAGRAIIMDNGDTLKLIDRIAHHTTAALSSVEVSSKNASNLVDNFSKYFDAANEQPKGNYQSFIIKSNNQKDRVAALCRFLDKHQIRYGRTKSALSNISAFDYQAGKMGTANVSTDDLIISAYQPKSVLAQVLFEPEPFLVDSLTYDITAWAMPYSYDLEAYATTQKISVDQTFESTIKMIKTNAVKKAYAYVVKWESLQDAKFLKDLMNQKIVARTSLEPFEIGGQKYEIGTLVINRGDNRKHDQKFDDIVLAVAEKNQQEVIPMTTGMVSKGADFGSAKMRLIEKPEILVLAGENISENAFGQIWYFFEQDLDYQITIVDPKELKNANLNPYNILIMPDGRYRDIDDKTLDKIKNWVKTGGKIIAMGSALSKLEDKSGFTLSKYATKKEKDEAKRNREAATLNNRLKVYEGQERKGISNAMPGAIYKLKLDNTHPLGFGLSKSYFSLKTSRRNYHFLKNTWNVGTIGKNPVRLGFVGANAHEQMKETTVFGVQSMGDGSVVYMVDNPLFRGFWQQGKFLFSNAIFMVD